MSNQKYGWNMSGSSGQSAVSNVQYGWNTTNAAGAVSNGAAKVDSFVKETDFVCSKIPVDQVSE